ncbi:hypothetical protein AB0K52_22585 [Glycomyces sp. NPDC049804]|uniref:hypothetical protein n=1 Tax=Glycomyces sp. NPDC049804 TaxID=3154363 RepID=UPI003445B462
MSSTTIRYSGVPENSHSRGNTDTAAYSTAPSTEPTAAASAAGQSETEPFDDRDRELAELLRARLRDMAARDFDSQTSSDIPNLAMAGHHAPGDPSGYVPGGASAGLAANESVPLPQIAARRAGQNAAPLVGDSTGRERSRLAGRSSADSASLRQSEAGDAGPFVRPQSETGTVGPSARPQSEARAPGPTALPQVSAGTAGPVSSDPRHNPAYPHPKNPGLFEEVDGFYDWADRRLFLSDGSPDPMTPGAYRYQTRPDLCLLDAADDDPWSPRYEPDHLRHKPGDDWLIDKNRPYDVLDPGPFGAPGWFPDRRTGRHRRDELPDPIPWWEIEEDPEKAEWAEQAEALYDRRTRFTREREAREARQADLVGEADREGEVSGADEREVRGSESREAREVGERKRDGGERKRDGGDRSGPTPPAVAPAHLRVVPDQRSHRPRARRSGSDRPSPQWSVEPEGEDPQETRFRHGSVDAEGQGPQQAHTAQPRSAAAEGAVRGRGTPLASVPPRPRLRPWPNVDRQEGPHGGEWVDPVAEFRFSKLREDAWDRFLDKSAGLAAAHMQSRTNRDTAIEREGGPTIGRIARGLRLIAGLLRHRPRQSETDPVSAGRPPRGADPASPHRRPRGADLVSPDRLRPREADSVPPERHAALAERTSRFAQAMRGAQRARSAVSPEAVRGHLSGGAAWA